VTAADITTTVKAATVVGMMKDPVAALTKDPVAALTKDPVAALTKDPVAATLNFLTRTFDFVFLS
jgi:hypothetical protein